MKTHLVCELSHFLERSSYHLKQRLISVCIMVTEEGANCIVHFWDSS